MSGTDSGVVESRLQRGEVKLVPFTRGHLAGARKLLQAIGWMHRPEDCAVTLDLGQGFVLEHAGEVVGTALWWPFGETHASTGMIIVARRAQGRGHGALLMDVLLAAAQGRTVTLNSTAEGLAPRQRRGCVAVGTIQQHRGLPPRQCEAPPANFVRAMTPADVDVVARLDEETTGWTRPQARDRAGRCGRPGRCPGPGRSRAGTGGATFVRIDNCSSTGLRPWLEGIGLAQVGEAPTMVRGAPAPASGPARMFALANPSFD